MARRKKATLFTDEEYEQMEEFQNAVLDSYGLELGQTIYVRAVNTENRWKRDCHIVGVNSDFSLSVNMQGPIRSFYPHPYGDRFEIKVKNSKGRWVLYTGP